VYGEDDSCKQIEVCGRCGERLASDPAWVEHVWREWEYERAASCKQMRVCARCGDKEERAVHDWGEWGYERADDCTQMRVCGRCEDREERTVHEWGEWQDKEKNSSQYCEQVRIFRRGDGVSEEREGGHDLVYVEDDSYWPVQDKVYTAYCTKCRRCNP
jgi:hypothetical protein